VLARGIATVADEARARPTSLLPGDPRRGMDALDASVREAMTTPLVTVDGDRPLGDAAGQFGRHGVGSLVVVAGGHEGIVTERDVVAAVAAGIDPSTTPVRDVMSAPLVTIPVSATLGEAVEAMNARGVEHLPVVEDGEPVGIVTTTDLVDALAPELGEVAGLFEARGPDE
jgi:CBS domain-containing protein